jgi:hypothetical protein
MAPSPDPISVWRLEPGHPDCTGPVADDVDDLDPERLEGLTIFKLRQQPTSTVLVTGAVVRRIRDAGHTGGDLTQVWTP